ncbi:hypothetical protein [Pannonibacter tanglangensis]|uniref:hypothetical protein n=1 Tax=Pannonibacter tanglangensis TaxID=2750084 RepID=UPI001AD8A557|nr:hypothetical protein [Pannonibacter sp. XCT-53]
MRIGKIYIIQKISKLALGSTYFRELITNSIINDNITSAASFILTLPSLLISLVLHTPACSAAGRSTKPCWNAPCASPANPCRPSPTAPPCSRGRRIEDLEGFRSWWRLNSRQDAALSETQIICAYVQYLKLFIVRKRNKEIL